jgi:cell wall-associated NlpC family hydrolase
LSRCRRLCLGLVVVGCTLPVAPAHAKFIHFGDRYLRQGMHGRDVRVLQTYLTQMGVDTTADGQFGPGTSRSVKSWERGSSLHIDGRVSRQDAAALRGQVDSGEGALQGANGGASPVSPVVGKATLGSDGLAVPPSDAPPEVVAVINAANQIVGKPYRYGGGHAKWQDSGYDCSGSVSYALHGAGLLKRAMDSTEFESYGESGPGTWITIYGNSGHAFMVVAGLRFDTGYNDSTSSGPKWSTKMRPSSGYVVRHPDGF